MFKKGNLSRIQGHLLAPGNRLFPTQSSGPCCSSTIIFRKLIASFSYCLLVMLADVGYAN